MIRIVLYISLFLRHMSMSLFKEGDTGVSWDMEGINKEAEAEIFFSLLNHFPNACQGQVEARTPTHLLLLHGSDRHQLLGRSSTVCSHKHRKLDGEPSSCAEVSTSVRVADAVNSSPNALCESSGTYYTFYKICRMLYLLLFLQYSD